MRKSKFTEEEIIGFLKQAEAGMAVQVTSRRPALQAAAGGDARPFARYGPSLARPVSGRSLWGASSGARQVREGGETPTFVAEARRLWSTEERLEFFAWIASEPDAGAVLKDSGGCRKVRWGRPGSRKRDGVRVIYFTRLAAAEPRMIRQEIEDDIDQASQATKRR